MSDDTLVWVLIDQTSAQWKFACCELPLSLKIDDNSRSVNVDEVKKRQILSKIIDQML